MNSELYGKKFILNRRLNSTEELIISLLRSKEDCTDEIYYRETLKSRLYETQKGINDE